MDGTAMPSGEQTQPVQVKTEIFLREKAGRTVVAALHDVQRQSGQW